jgi:hypothetical protein
VTCDSTSIFFIRATARSFLKNNDNPTPFDNEYMIMAILLRDYLSGRLETVDNNVTDEANCWQQQVCATAG